MVGTRTTTKTEKGEDTAYLSQDYPTVPGSTEIRKREEQRECCFAARRGIFRGTVGRRRWMRKHQRKEGSRHQPL